MKRCQSDELQPQQGEEDGAAPDEAAGHLLGADLRPGEATAGANSAGGPTSDPAVAAPNPGPRSKPPDLKVSTDLAPKKPAERPPSAEVHSRTKVVWVPEVTEDEWGGDYS